MTFFLGLLFVTGVALVARSILARQTLTQTSIAMYSGVFVPDSSHFLEKVSKFFEKHLITHRLAPWGTVESVKLQLTHAGNGHSISYFRRQQVLGFLLCEFLFTVWLIIRASDSGLPSPIFIVVVYVTLCPLSGAVVFEFLKNKTKDRANQVDLELPAMLDLIAFSVVAGEPIVLAMKRVASTCSGELALLFQRVNDKLEGGETLEAALQMLRTDTASNNLFRAIHAIEIAIERGTPLAEVLKGQAQESRSQYRAHLLRLAGKKETIMMLPVVFLILPMIVFVALFPGLAALQFR